MAIKKGDRVGAIAYGEEKNGITTVYFLGYGTFLGYEIPESEEVKFFGISLKKINHKNPCILLDNGEKVYGCECWWGTEEKVKEILEAADKVVTIDISDYRKGKI